MSEPLSQIKDLIEDCLNALGSKYAKPEAIELCLATGLVESNYRYIKQIGSGIASSYWQIEGDTCIDNIQNYLQFRVKLAEKCAEVSETPLELWQTPDKKRWENVLKFNMNSAIIHCRLKYWRDSRPLPTTTNGMAQAWKQIYNTSGGSGSVGHFLEVVGKHI